MIKRIIPSTSDGQISGIIDYYESLYDYTGTRIHVPVGFLHNFSDVKLKFCIFS